MADILSSANSPPELPNEPVPQSMIHALVNQNQRLLEENHHLNARLEVYAKKLGRKKVKLEKERMVSRMHKNDYEATSRKLWEKTLAMDKLFEKIKTVKSRCRCLAFFVPDCLNIGIRIVNPMLSVCL
ncbi:hypothetical protein L6452_02656 [Arctium lappa]|uniref:Uncharacterized protein n=1 Tax=Arctium lappa TaxID=4217 RepID=A0ACB9FLA5_ARCLA|nr:hypothetical protein L6452_02656 [Arctium lappa]